jgi:hypothetical protein
MASPNFAILLAALSFLHSERFSRTLLADVESRVPTYSISKSLLILHTRRYRNHEDQLF